MANAGVSGMWAPFKELSAIVESAIVHKQADAYTDLEVQLNKNRPAFISLLKNAEKSATERDQVKNANKQGVQLLDHPALIKLQDATIQEVLLLSDALDLNELACVELMLAAEQQIPNFPGLAQVQIATLLYHDGRRCLVAALKLLLMARTGITWKLEVDERVVELVSDFTNRLIGDGLVDKLLHIVATVTVEVETEKLTKCRGIPSPGNKHRRLIEEQRLIAAECLFAIACQQPLTKESCISVMNHLKAVSSTATVDGGLSRMTVHVLMSLLVSFNTNAMERALEAIGEDEFETLPYLDDKKYISDLHQTIVRPDIQHWSTPAIKSIIQFCWGVFLRTCAMHPHLAEENEDIFEEDDGVLSISLDGEALRHIRSLLVSSERFHSEEYFVRVTHMFVTSFVIKFPMKIKELRTRSDEHARIQQAHVYEGLEPPQGLTFDFQELKKLISSLYSTDPLGLSLNTEFWVPPEPMGGVFSPQPIRKHQQALDQRQLALNKFIRLSGDGLQPAMYVPYVEMLTALSTNEQAATYCFRLLSSETLDQAMGAVSWDHFFTSIKRYYLSLRTGGDVIAPAGVHARPHQEISPDELLGLESVLKLIRTVAEHSESVRVSFCEHQGWLPVALLFGLACCAVPASLKGLLLSTLAAFARTTDIAASMWQSLEAAQILQTVTSTTKSGICVELQEIESRNETYPQTRGFIRLIDSLTDAGIPTSLGAGQRSPGFQPYLDFLVEHVLLKFKSRAYQDVTEKWSIASEVLVVLTKIISSYEPSAEDFASSRSIEIQGVIVGSVTCGPPGHALMVMLLSDSPLFRLAMAVVEEVLRELEGTPVLPDATQDSLERVAGLCLKLLELGTTQQALFMETARAVGSTTLLAPLEELLLSINPKSGRPDYITIIARYVTLTRIAPDITLSCVRILQGVAQGSHAQKEIVPILTSDEVSSRELLVGFSEHLEFGEAEEIMDESSEIEEVKTEARVNARDAIRQGIVELIIDSLDLPPPNLSQFLLGFQLNGPVAKTNLQDPGIGGFPKSCLHAILEVLNRGGSTLTQDCPSTTTPKLSELLYKLIYMLCAHQEMGAPTRRYLRVNADFFISHCSMLPFVRMDQSEDSDLRRIHLTNQQSWLLRALAIDLKVVSASRMRSGLLQLFTVLFNDSTSQAFAPLASHDRTLNQTTTADRSRMANLSSTLLATGVQSLGVVEKPNLILELLSGLSFVQDHPSPLQMNLFDQSAIETLILNCEETQSGGFTTCNVRRLYKVLVNEINQSQATTGPAQRQELMKDVRAVLQHAVGRNVARESFQSKRGAFEAWRQVVETTFAAAPSDLFDLRVKQQVLLELLDGLLEKMNAEDNLSELSAPIAGTLLSLMANLWFTFTQAQSMSKQPSSSPPLDIASVSRLLPSLLECVIAGASGPARMRANLYGVFLYYVQIGALQNSVVDEGVSGGIFASQTRESWESSTLSILNRYGEALLEVVSRDTCDGPCISRMMAMSVLDAIASIDWKQKYLSLMSSRGYLRVFIDQLIQDDVDLHNVLSLEPTSMKSLYLFEAKMAFLSKIAQTDFGAQLLLQSGLLARLTECSFLDHHIPDSASGAMQSASFAFSSTNDPFLPSLIERYQKIFTSFVKMMLAFLSSLGTSHRVAVGQIQNLVVSHQDVFQNILQDRTGNDQTSNSLNQLAQTVSLLSMLPVTETKDDSWEIMNDDQRAWRTFMMRVQRQMLSLLKKYSAKYCSKVLKSVLEKESGGETCCSEKGLPYRESSLVLQSVLLQIRAQALTFCKNIVASHGLSGPYSRILFAPSFTEGSSRRDSCIITGKSASHQDLPSLDVLAQELRDAPGQLLNSLEQKSLLERKRKSLSSMSQDEMNEILSQSPSPDFSERVSASNRQIIIGKCLDKLIELREREANTLSYIIEHATYILWRHLDYYFVHCVPSDDQTFIDPDLSYRPSAPGLTRIRKVTDSALSPISKLNISSPKKSSKLTEGGITKDDLRQLQCEAPTILTDQMWKKVLETDQVHGRVRSRLAFTSALVRRIQGMIQLNS